MKLLIACVVAAAAGAVAPPKISLDLARGSLVRTLKEAVPHPEGLLQPDGTPVTSRQDWSEECAASTATSEATCPFPQARAFDHNDLTIQVRENIWLVDQAGQTMTKRVSRSQVQFDKPAVYLFKFDATDSAGNHAEQVVFSLILNDKVAPRITLCSCPLRPFGPSNPTSSKTCMFDQTTGAQRIVVEAASKWKMCRAGATDNCGLKQGKLSCAAGSSGWPSITNKLKYCITKCPNNFACLSKAKTCSNWVVANDISIDKALTTKQVGRYIVTVAVADNAGAYGNGGASNAVRAIMDVTFEDKTVPVITPLGQAPVERFVCNHKAKYTDSSNGVGRPSVRLTDNLDTAKELFSRLKVDKSEVKTGLPNDYWVTYNVRDANGNAARGCANSANGPQDCGAKRLVQVRDMSNPTIKPKDGRYKIDYLVGSIADIDSIDAGVTVDDECDANIGKRTIERTWVVLPSWKGKKLTTWIANRPGTYVRQYKVCDASTRCSTFRRTFVGTDKTAPIITVLGKQTLTIPAKRNGPAYQDEGATCRDYVDGLFSATVSEKGDIVDPTRPGTYIIRYECADLKGNKAQEMTRTVIVKDFDCPKITLKGLSTIQVEAGSKFTDPGWSTFDEIDGNISKRCTNGNLKGCTEVTGDSINTMNAFNSRRSCSEIKVFQKDATPSGWYYITTFVEATKSFARVKVWCDMDTKSLDGRVPGYTYYPCDGCKSTKPYGSGTKAPQGDCEQFGMKMAQFDARHGTNGNFRIAPQWKGAATQLAKQFFTAAGIPSTNYLCSTNDHNDEQTRSSQDDIRNGRYHGSLSHSIQHDQMTANEEGKYIITYQARDNSDVKQCAIKRRTVIVRDTFKPVITLHLPGKNGDLKLIQWSKVDKKGNPAADPARNPFLKDGPFMAEEGSQSQGWLIAAAASAVAGVALLTMSAKRPVATSVPV